MKCDESFVASGKTDTGLSLHYSVENKKVGVNFNLIPLDICRVSLDKFHLRELEGSHTHSQLTCYDNTF